MTDERTAEIRARRARTQRERRATMRRVDFYASEEAGQILDALWRPGVGGDTSSVINRALLAFAEAHPELLTDG